MEQKLVNKILIASTALSCVIAIGAGVVAFKVYKGATMPETGTQENVQAATQAVDSGPVSFAGFVGKPTSNTVNSADGKKSIDLRGHLTENTNKAYENVPDTDTMIRKIIISPDTILRRVTQGAKMPIVEGIEFDQFVTVSTTEVYVASYEAKEGESINDSTPAYSVIVFGKK